ncbi:MAG: hypothetical protein PHY43_10200 [Verrucomicrobiales bacterium]|nr:hypothetical protein [Verrucomicrobiales bacterium]
MKISETPHSVLIWNARFFQIPFESLNAWKPIKNQCFRRTLAFNLTQDRHKFRMQTHRRNLAVFCGGCTNQRKRFGFTQMQIRPFERGQFRPPQSSMRSHQINRLAFTRDRKQTFHFIHGE